MYRCESWTIKKAEHQRTDVFNLWCWRRPLRVPWNSRRSNQSILKEINPEYSLEGLMLKPKLWSSNTLATWCEESTHWKRPWCWERSKAGGEEDDTGWDGWMASPTLWTWVWADSRRHWRTGNPGMLQSMGLQRVKHDWETEQDHTYIPSLMSLPPFRLPPGYQRAQDWASCVTQQFLPNYPSYTDNEYMLMLLSPFISLSPSPTVSTSPFPTSAPPCLPCK